MKQESLGLVLFTPGYYSVEVFCKITFTVNYNTKIRTMRNTIQQHHESLPLVS